MPLGVDASLSASSSSAVRASQAGSSLFSGTKGDIILGGGPKLPGWFTPALLGLLLLGGAAVIVLIIEAVSRHL